HLIADNYATHKHADVKRWLAKHPRFHMHFTPTSSSWLNLVERFFRDLTDFITEKSFASVGELSDAIIGFLAEHNKTAKRYLWRVPLLFSTHCIRFTKAEHFAGDAMSLRRLRYSTMVGPTRVRPRKAGDAAHFFTCCSRAEPKCGAVWRRVIRPIFLLW